MKISKVLYVPNLRFNLLSVAALLKVGVHVEFLQDRAVLSKFGNIIGEAMMRGKLLYLTMDVETESALTAGPGEISNVEGWQRRYAQPRYQNAEKLHRSKMVQGMTFTKTAKKFGEMHAENGFVRPAARPLTRIHRSPTKAIRSKTPLKCGTEKSQRLIICSHPGVRRPLGFRNRSERNCIP